MCTFVGWPVSRPKPTSWNLPADQPCVPPPHTWSCPSQRDKHCGLHPRHHRRHQGGAHGAPRCGARQAVRHGCVMRWGGRAAALARWLVGRQQRVERSLEGREWSGHGAAAIAPVPAPPVTCSWLLPLPSAGIDEEGLLGEKKRRKVLSVLKETDVAVVVLDAARLARWGRHCWRRADGWAFGAIAPSSRALW